LVESLSMLTAGGAAGFVDWVVFAPYRGLGGVVDKALLGVLP
jgi:hypothetical protein